MLAMSPLLCPSLGWEYPLGLGGDQGFNSLDLDFRFLPDLSSSLEEYDDRIKRSESPPQGTSSNDHSDNPILAKKLCHNASERDRRKKINTMYSSLRALLPATDHRKKLSIPTTIGRVLEYIPQIQKEIEGLIQKKELLSPINIAQGKAGELCQEEKPKMLLIKENSSFSISANKLGYKEIIIQISSLFEKISISELLMQLEKSGYVAIDVSSFQTFGGTLFYNLHLWMEGSNAMINLEKLNEALMLLLQNQKQIHI